MNWQKSIGKPDKKLAIRRKVRLLCVGLAALLVYLSAVQAHAEPSFIKGKVVDKENNQPLRSVTVTIPTLRIGAITDEKGNFSFEAPPGEHTIEVRYIGWQTITQKITVKQGQTTNVTFTMTTQDIMTNEIVVVGLTGEVDRNTLGNQISSVDSKDIAKVVSTSAIDAIDGRVPGVSVTRNSGTPGAGTYITMRGRKSILGSSEPLYVVDGVIMDNTSLYDGSGRVQFSNRAIDINPDDIESIQILKGASAAAIYGAQAANGVVLITTKRGKLTSYDKPAQITFNSSYTIEQKAGSVPLQTTYGQVPNTSLSWGDSLAPGTSTYKQDEAPFRTGFTHEQSLTIAGGVPQFDYLLNATYNNTDGYVIGSGLERTSIRANIGIQLLPGVTMQTNNNYIFFNNDLPQDGSNTSGILLGALRTPPEFNNADYLNPDGSQHRFASYDNPIWTQNFNKYNTKLERFIHSTDLKWQPADWVAFKGTLGLDRYQYSLFQRLAVGSASSPSRSGLIEYQKINNKQINLDLTATFTQRLWDDQILANLVVGSQIFWTDRQSTYETSSQTLSYDQVQAGSTKDATSSFFEKKMVGYFGQLTMTGWDRLSLTLALRRDGSSTFGESEQFHYYPKVGVSYVLTKESFMEDTKDWLSNLRLRGSWGEAGSPNLPDMYTTNFLYGVAGFFDPWFGTDVPKNVSRKGQIGLKQGGGITPDEYILAGNIDINPELTIEREFGVDIGFLDNRINFEGTYYLQNIFDMILQVPLPTSTGYDQQLRNAAEMWNRGWELSLNIIPFQSSDFQWSTTFNFAKNENEVTKLHISDVESSNPEYVSLNGGFTGIQNIAMKGQPLGVFWGYGWIRDVNGDIVYTGDKLKVDENGEFVRDAQGHVYKDPNGVALEETFIGIPTLNSPEIDSRLHIIGNPNPDFEYSWRNDFTFFKDFSVGFLFDAVIGFDVWNGTRGALYNFGTAGETVDRNELWFNADGKPVMDISDPNTPVQATREYYYRYFANGFYNNEPHVERASFIKLRELSFEYRWHGLESWNITAVTFSFAARNVLTITDYDGYDPEVNTFSLAEGRGFDYFTLPQVHSYRFGISIIY